MMSLFIKELSEIYKSKKLLILVVVLLFTAIGSAIFAKMIPVILSNVEMPEGFVVQVPEPTWKDAIDQFMKNISQIVLIVVVLVFAGSIAEEKSKKTLEIVLSKPVSRSKFVLAKIFASASVLIASFSIASVIFYIYTATIFESFSVGRFFYLALFTLIFILLILLITIFTSTICSSQIVAAGLSFFIEIILLAVLPYVRAISDYLPVYAINHYKELLDGGSISDFLPSFFVSLGLIVIFAMASMFLFQRQEVER